ncbi:MAG: Bifunctional protein glmU [uncultured bacterium]|nr:MAG: Bifunctional protein glmU [uncultured bacterium]
MQNVQVVILAAGKGTRMNKGKESPIPKALYKIGNKPMIWYILDTLKNIKTQEHKNKKTEKLNITRPIIVVGYKSKEVIKKLGTNYTYAIQEERLGTGHAAKIGLESISASQLISKGSESAPISVGDVFIMQSDDSAFYTKEMLTGAINRHQKEDVVLSFLTTNISGLSDYGRVIRDEQGEVTGVVEKENMTDEQKKLNEINCGAYLMDLAWAKENVPQIKQHHIGGTEYPLPDVIKMAVEQKQKVLGIQINPDEWVGINSLDQLEYANRLMQKRH